MKNRLGEGVYFVHYDRLYYILEQDEETFDLLVENCTTFEKVWATSESLHGYSDLRVVEAA